MSAPNTSRSPTVAVIGSGVAGLSAAYLLRQTHEVTLYEADERLGGHAHTHDVTDPDGTTHVVDTGFIVHNPVTYPHLTRLFRELGVTTRPAEMSMSIHHEHSGLVYAGGRGVGGIFARPRQALDPRFLSLLTQVKRFHRRAQAFLEQHPESDLTTFGEFLRTESFSPRFQELYAVPLVSCVWSTGTDAALEYPARYLFQFLANHGMLTVTGAPQWYTVTGGSRSYVDTIARRLPRVRTGQAVATVQREPDGVRVVDASGTCDRFDRIVLAVHADQSLDMLADPSAAEKEVLGSFRYTQSTAVLHTDARLLPRPTRARACWNYRTATGPDDRGPTVTYWMNRLQGIESTEPYLVTLNDTGSIVPDRIRAVAQYQTPIYDSAAVAAQSRLPELTTAQTAYAGAYHGWGFHEDGCRSGVEAARAFGMTW